MRTVVYRESLGHAYGNLGDLGVVFACLYYIIIEGGGQGGQGGGPGGGRGGDGSESMSADARISWVSALRFMRFILLVFQTHPCRHPASGDPRPRTQACTNFRMRNFRLFRRLVSYRPIGSPRAWDAS